eukprot:scaffold312_cov354-Prasinococcus_capsulatus_cf.AAC.2
MYTALAVRALYPANLELLLAREEGAAAAAATAIPVGGSQGIGGSRLRFRCLGQPFREDGLRGSLALRARRGSLPAHGGNKYYSARGQRSGRARCARAAQ